MRGETVGPRSVATAGWGEASRRAAQQPHFTIHPLASAGGCDVVSTFHMHATLFSAPRVSPCEQPARKRREKSVDVNQGE